jgi:hypothetical protein
MTILEATPFHAGRLIYKGLQPKLVPHVDNEYRNLLNLYESSPPFRTMVEAVAEGLELEVLDISPDGAFFVASSRESRFALRLADIRTGMPPDEKARVVLIHTAIAAMFFPTADRLNDDSFDPPPVLETDTLNVLKQVCRNFQRLSDSGSVTLQKELEPGWKSVLEMPETRPDAGRKVRNTLEGSISFVFRDLQDHGFVRLDSDEPSPRWTPTKRYAAHLRRKSVSALFGIARQARAHEV